jgi:cation diffusion facilitator CzcD-associated flavoprotein CzcO
MEQKTTIAPDILHLDIVIIGAGMGGLGAAAKLRDSGLRIAVLERAGSLGGVWRDNQYPNIACDTPIELYSYSFFLGSHWTRNFASGGEILAYFEKFSTHFGVDDLIAFNTDVKKVAWNAETAVWEIEATDRRRWISRFVIWAGGILSSPAIPQLEGLDRFQGEMLHTTHWHGGLDLAGKTVAVVGSGASAIQVVPYVVEHAQKIYSFVRTPSYVLPRPDVFYQQEERSNPDFFLKQQRNRRGEWLERFEFIAKARFPMNLDIIEQQETEWAKHFSKTITDPDLREILTPKYRFGCKRPLFSNEYYPAMNHANLTVVGDGISAVYADGLIDNHTNKYAVDVILWATGFDPDHMLGPLDIIGSDGRSLTDQWSDIPSAFYGTLVKGFPNLFLIGGPNIGGASNSDFIESQLWLIQEAIRISDEQNAAIVEVDEDAFDRFNEDVQSKASASVLVRGNCISWYLSDKTGGVFTHWPGTIQAFQSAVRNDSIAGLRFDSAALAKGIPTKV